MADRARHAFGNSANLQTALDSGAIDAYDILFLDGDTEPKVGWVDKNGSIKIVDTKCVITVDGDNLPETGEVGKIYIFGGESYFYNGTEFVNMCKAADLSALEAEIATKVSAEEVEAKIETAVTEAINDAVSIEVVEF